MGKLWSDTVSGDELRRTQRSIDEAMRGVHDDLINRPQALNPNFFAEPARVQVGGAGVVRGSGWVDSRPLEPPFAPGFLERKVGAMIDQATLSPREIILRDLRALSPEQRTKLLGEMAERAADPRTKELLRR
jgi:hypothetical protein